MIDDKIEIIKEKLSENKRVVVLLGFIVVVLLGFLTWSKVMKPKAETKPYFPTISTTALKNENHLKSSKTEKTSEKATDGSKNQKIVVDIKGAVKNEGVYELPSGSRVTDVIKQAGGFAEDADKKSVNLAMKLTDETVIYVARVGENIEAANQSSITDKDSSQETKSEKINLNKATLAELQKISGIGAKRAQDIIDYRDAKGGFTSVEDLVNVSGIGEKTLEKLKSEVSVD